MKIYHKKNFLYGMASTLLGVALLILSALSDYEWSGVVIAAICLLLGISLLIRSTSMRLSKEDRTEDMDERNKLVFLKNRSRAFQIQQYLSLIVATVLFIISKYVESQMLAYIGMGCAILFVISLFVDIGTYIFYDSRV